MSGMSMGAVLDGREAWLQERSLRWLGIDSHACLVLSMVGLFVVYSALKLAYGLVLT